MNTSRLHRFYADNENPADKTGRLAQLDRALVSGTRGHGFKSHIARHNFNKEYRDRLSTIVYFRFEVIVNT